MKTKTGRNLIGFLFLSAIICSSNAALADKGGHGHAKFEDWDSDHRGRGHDDWDERERVFIPSGDRVVVERYIEKDYYRKCPPGLAKKHNGCLPPGQAKKHYIIGHALPEYVVYQPAPRVLVRQLQPVPVGYEYVVVDQDVLLISAVSKMVIDAITVGR